MRNVLLIYAGLLTCCLCAMAHNLQSTEGNTVIFLLLHLHSNDAQRLRTNIPAMLKFHCRAFLPLVAVRRDM